VEERPFPGPIYSLVDYGFSPARSASLKIKRRNSGLGILRKSRTRSTIRVMPLTSKAGIATIAVAVVLVMAQAIERWSVLETILTGLDNSGPVGHFLKGLLVSPIVVLVIALAGLYLMFEGRREIKSRNSVGSREMGNEAVGVPPVYIDFKPHIETRGGDPIPSHYCNRHGSAVRARS
jgi:hypothetical protein